LQHCARIDQSVRQALRPDRDIFGKTLTTKARNYPNTRNYGESQLPLGMITSTLRATAPWPWLPIFESSLPLLLGRVRLQLAITLGLNHVFLSAF
jgi:hypothetical protein